MNSQRIDKRFNVILKTQQGNKLRNLFYVLSAVSFIVSILSAIGMIWMNSMQHRVGLTAVLFFTISFILFKLGNWMEGRPSDRM